MSDKNIISNAFQTFMTAAADHAQAWGGMVQGLASAILLGLPAAGHRVTQALPAALAAYDAE
jgi:hypothetical protein